MEEFFFFIWQMLIFLFIIILYIFLRSMLLYKCSTVSFLDIVEEAHGNTQSEHQTVQDTIYELYNVCNSPSMVYVFCAWLLLLIYKIPIFVFSRREIIFKIDTILYLVVFLFLLCEAIVAEKHILYHIVSKEMEYGLQRIAKWLSNVFFIFL